MLWLKAIHVIAVVTWFAGLFYLPRLFVYHADAKDTISVERFQIMERRLFAIMISGQNRTNVLGARLRSGLLQSSHSAPGLWELRM